MGELRKCTLCERKEDPRWGFHVDGRRFPMCDGCAPDSTNQEYLARVTGICRALPKGERPCSYCGTTIDDDGLVVATGERHHVSQCLDYVAAVKNAYVKRALAAEAERDALRAEVERLRGEMPKGWTE